LQVSGKLDPTMYGPSEDIDTGTRRTVYATLSRGRSSAEVMKLYDAPQPMQHIPMRYLTINPQQALFVMNSGLVRRLASDLAKDGDAVRTPGPQFAPKARHVILLFMTGGPSQVDLWDPKPALMKYAGQRPATADLRTERTTAGLLPSTFSFSKQGKSGIDMSELLPHL